ncbi:hypothetical protein SAMN04488543_1030 [Friedmanniella luteola]|uniref:Uncharacterized protein n=1 Tax=Friedmanniella luteola TaxID=546871 RepID=A0A1H1PAF3_9ACTN|nr:hypothetical protein SAMN04488543_1030 [Friedmanniella luteola]
MLDPSASAARLPVPSRPVGADDREPVEVRTEAVDGVVTPTQLLRDGRLWVVRAAAALPGPLVRWRVDATPGPGVPAVPLELSDQHGRWTLVEVSAAGTGSPSWS